MMENFYIDSHHFTAPPSSDIRPTAEALRIQPVAARLPLPKH
jgi:hypothetical protein